MDESKVINSLVKQKISKVEEEYSFSTFVFLLIKNTDKLNFEKIIKIWKDIEYVNSSLMLVISKSKDKKLKNEVKNYSDKLNRLYVVAKIKADTIENYSRHVQTSIEYAKRLQADEPGRKLYDLNTIEKLEPFLRNLKLGLNIKTHQGKEQYKHRKRIFTYWRKFYDIYKEFNHYLIKIINLLKSMEEIKETLTKIEEISGAGTSSPRRRRSATGAVTEDPSMGAVTDNVDYRRLDALVGLLKVFNKEEGEAYEKAMASVKEKIKNKEPLGLIPPREETTTTSPPAEPKPAPEKVDKTEEKEPSPKKPSGNKKRMTRKKVDKTPKKPKPTGMAAMEEEGYEI